MLFGDTLGGPFSWNLKKEHSSFLHLNFLTRRCFGNLHNLSLQGSPHLDVLLLSLRIFHLLHGSCIALKSCLQSCVGLSFYDHKRKPNLHSLRNKSKEFGILRTDCSPCSLNSEIEVTWYQPPERPDQKSFNTNPLNHQEVQSESGFLDVKLGQCLNRPNLHLLSIAGFIQLKG